MSQQTTFSQPPEPLTSTPSRVPPSLTPEAQGALPLYAEAIAMLAAGLSILLPPLAIVIVIGLAWLLRGGRRREGEKYAGLRILR